MPKVTKAKAIKPEPQKTNVHPADRLAELRAEIKYLQEQADAARDELLADGADLIGYQNTANIQVQTRENIDRKALEDTYGAEFIKPFLKTTSFKVVKTERINHAKSRENPF